MVDPKGRSESRDEYSPIITEPKHKSFVFFQGLNVF